MIVRVIVIVIMTMIAIFVVVIAVRDVRRHGHFSAAIRPRA